MDPLLNRASAASAPPGPRALRVVWERAADLAVEVFRLCRGSAGVEPELCEPLRASALAVPTHLARVLGRAGREVRPSLILALGALAEVESHLALARRLGGESEESLARLRSSVEVLRRLIVAAGIGSRPAPQASPVPPLSLTRPPTIR